MVGFCWVAGATLVFFLGWWFFDLGVFSRGVFDCCFELLFVYVVLVLVYAGWFGCWFV